MIRHAMGPPNGSRKKRRDARTVQLDEDLAAVFTTDASVNEALRFLLRIREVPALPPRVVTAQPAPAVRAPLRPSARLPRGPGPRGVKPLLQPAVTDDIPMIVALRNDAAAKLTGKYGTGHWSSVVTEQAVARDMKTSIVLVAKESNEAIATLRLATRKPWAIDVTGFSACARPIYLHDMAVAPRRQRKGIGRRCVDDAIACARDMQGGAIRLDAYDAEAGAGRFYERCGFREVARVVYRDVPLVYLEHVL